MEDRKGTENATLYQLTIGDVNNVRGHATTSASSVGSSVEGRDAGHTLVDGPVNGGGVRTALPS